MHQQMDESMLRKPTDPIPHSNNKFDNGGAASSWEYLTTISDRAVRREGGT